MADVRLLELRNTFKGGGGPDKTILLSAERHDRTKVETVVAYVRDATDNEFRIGDKARARGLTFYEIEEHGKLDLRVVLSLREIVHRHRINLVHSHDYKSDLFAYLLRRRIKRQPPTVISTLHGWALLGMRGCLYWHLDVLLMRRFDHLIAVSQATKTDMVAAGVSPESISVIHNGIDTETWVRDRASTSLRQELGLEHAFPVIGYVGRITPEKDLRTWLRTAAEVRRRHSAARFIVVGEGRDAVSLGQCKKLAAALGIADQVHFLGYRDQLLPIYTAFDIFFLSSRREGICNSLLEAMAMGLPVVATDAGGTRELVVDGETGFVVPQQDVQGLAQAILSLVEDEPRRSCMGQAGRRRVERDFSLGRRMRQVEKVYQQVLENRRSRQPRPI